MAAILKKQPAFATVRRGDHRDRVNVILMSRGQSNQPTSNTRRLVLRQPVKYDKP